MPLEDFLYIPECILNEIIHVILLLSFHIFYSLRLSYGSTPNKKVDNCLLRKDIVQRAVNVV